MDLTTIIPNLLGAVLGGFIAAQIGARSSERIAQNRIRHELQMAALDKRLEVHQQAYTHWLNVMRNMHSVVKVSKILGPAFEWWDINCLYLQPDIAKKLRVAFLTAATWESTLKSSDMVLLKMEHESVNEVGPLIQTAMGLPKIDRQDLTPENSKKN